ncbi:hypothetical protein AB0910_12410 [Streptomyces sp. NPDC047002]|uniref:hypothetical protein n=1 Tax=Streptomyces sp. NPDC047002 TaxID=3155475 RepID=UPI003452548E
MSSTLPMPDEIWIDPDDRALYIGLVTFEPRREARVVVVERSSDDTEWQPIGEPFQVSLDWLQSACTYQPPPKPVEPSVARLTDALDTLLNEYTATASGQTPPTPEHAQRQADKVRTALDAVLGSRERERRRRYNAMQVQRARQRNRRGRR